jgi:hypothetical protein
VLRSITFVVLLAAASARAQAPAPMPLTPPTGQSAPLSAPVSTFASRAIAKNVLEELGAERVGLRDEASGGLPNDMWRGGDPEIVRAVLARLPRRMTSPAMRNIAHNLLLPAARQPRANLNAAELTAPVGGDEAVNDPAAPQAPWLLEARVAALVAMGDWTSVNELLDLVPQDRLTAALIRHRADGFLIAGQTDKACAEAQAALSRKPEPQWQKLLVYCQFSAKQPGAAQLGLSLLREEGLNDPLFFWAADQLQGLKTPAPVLTQRPAVLELVMLRAVGRALPDAVARDDDPTTMRIIAAMPVAPPEDTKEKLTAAQKKERARAAQEARILLSERAVALGVLDPEMLRARYLDLDLSQDAKPEQITDAAPNNVRARVLMFQMAKKQDSAAARAEVIGKAIDLARADRGQKGPDLTVVGKVYGPLLADLPPTPDLLWFAGHAARGLLAAGMPDKAAAWLDLVRQMARGSLEASGLADSLWAVEHLGRSDGRGELLPRALRAWQAGVPPEAGALQRQTLLNLLGALGDPVAIEDWRAVMAAPPAASTAAPSPALWQGLTLAARDGRGGETTAFGLAALGDAGPHVGSPVTLAKVIESLMMAGREADARALAVEAALVAGL